jgi:hypothetical protein
MSLQQSLTVIIKGAVEMVHDYEDAFKDLFLIGQTTWNNDDIKKRRLVQNAQNIGMVDMVFEALLNDKSFSETCNFLRSHAIRHDQQAKQKNARQVHSTCQPTSSTKKDKLKTVMTLINELQLQDSTGSNEEVEISESSKPQWYVNWHKYLQKSG